MATLQNLGHGINRLSNVFSADDCRRFIQQAEGFGFQPATINTLTGVKLETDVRNNDRVIFDSPELALEV